MEVSDIRRRVRGAIEQARQQAAQRRVRTSDAAREYDAFLVERAVPMFHQFASALVGEGHLFKVFTPAGSVRLAPERPPLEIFEFPPEVRTDPPAGGARG